MALVSEEICEPSTHLPPTADDHDAFACGRSAGVGSAFLLAASVGNDQLHDASNERWGRAGLYGCPFGESQDLLLDLPVTQRQAAPLLDLSNGPGRGSPLGHQSYDLLVNLTHGRPKLRQFVAHGQRLMESGLDSIDRVCGPATGFITHSSSTPRPSAIRFTKAK